MIKVTFPEFPGKIPNLTNSEQTEFSAVDAHAKDVFVIKIEIQPGAAHRNNTAAVQKY